MPLGIYQGIYSMRKLATHEISRLSPDEFAAAPKTPLVLVLDNIRSANNVGSIFRTADAFALSHLYLCGITATPPHRDIMKTAIGADQTVAWSHYQETTQVLAQLKQQAFRTLAVEQTSSSTLLQDVVLLPNQPLALVLGNEVNGVDQAVLDQCDGAIEVPQFGTKHSLNVAVCTGVVVWEMVRRIRMRG